MAEKKKLYKRKGFLAWGITSGALVVIMTTASILCNTTFSSLLTFAMGSGTYVYAEGEEAAYNASFDSKTESLANGKAVNLDMCAEGMTLLKNDNNALPIATPKSPNPSSASPKVSVFGKNSVNLAIGGSGSGAASGESVSLYDSLEEAGFETNPTLKSFYENTSLSGAARVDGTSDLDSGDTVVLSTAETPQSSYTSEVKNSYSDYNDAAIVVFTRIGGEGFDLPRTMTGATGYRNEDDHYLQLDQNETDLLATVCEQDFEHVIVLLNSGSAMELTFLEDPAYYAYQDKIDAAIWMGYPGNSGATAIGQILNGTINPSGRTVDTFAADFKKDPTWNNFGDNRIIGNYDKGVQGGDQYRDENGNLTLYYFVDYEEGIYIGYKYYETRGYTDGEDWYEDAVVYPFGYGLSYTTFDWDIKWNTLPASFSATDEMSVEVTVTNTGSVAGKDVVELYAGAPYTAGGIEKSYKNLVAYEKTSLLEPGQSETLNLTMDPYYVASYDYTDANNNGFKGYELEAGDYSFYVSHDAHNVEESKTLALSSDVQIANDPVTGNKVENLYTDCEDSAFDSDTQLSTVLSRNDWDGTWPTSPSDAEKMASADLINQFKDTSTNNPIDYDSYDYPMMGSTKIMSLRDMLYDENGEFMGFVDYDDERWDALLDQVSFSEALNTYNNAAYQVAGIDSIDMPSLIAGDGPVGWTSFINASIFEDTCSYCCGVIVASTWNKDLITEFGEAVGEEGLIGNNGTPYTCWYAPGTNIHRSPFGGRNFEYYSEDAYLSGTIAVAEIKGCQSKGTIPFLKHFALNEQETHRSITGDCSWVTEQAMRETFLRPFEIAVKEGGTKGIMSSFNRIGTRWTGGDYRLLTTILRDEWGFEGAVICDFNTIPAYMNPRQMAYAGGDLNLQTIGSEWSDADESSTGDVVVLRRAIKNIAYFTVNSNAMKGTIIGQNLAPWQTLVIWLDVGVGAIIVIWGALYIGLSIYKDRKNPPLHDESTSSN